MSSPPPPPSFSLQDFQQLVCTAFDLHQNAAASYFDSDTDDDDHRHLADALPIASPPSSPPKRSALSLLKSIRTRASALVLRPAQSAPLSVPPALPSPALRPSLSSQRTQTPTPLLSRPSAPSFVAPFDSSSPLSRSLSCSPPSSFLPLSQTHSSQPGIARRLPHQSFPTDSLPSFFDDSAYHPLPPHPSYARTSTPLHPHPAHVHSRLPPLRKSKSFASGIFKKPSSFWSAKSPIPVPPPLPDVDYLHSDWLVDPRCPSPFTNPRDSPLPPSAPVEDHLNVPAYVYERRGSTTSTCTTTSTKTSSSLADRISQALPTPLSLPFSKLRSRSKHNLSVITSSNSSPSSASSASIWSPVTPVTPSFAFPAPAPGDTPPHKRSPAYTRSSFPHAKEDALAIGRVLTPEHDPFAKGDIEVSCDITPRPPSPISSSRRGSRQNSAHNAFSVPPHRDVVRSSQGHSHTGSGDTIAPLLRPAIPPWCPPGIPHPYASEAVTSPKRPAPLSRSFRSSQSSYASTSRSLPSSPLTSAFPPPVPPPPFAPPRFPPPDKPLPNLPPGPYSSPLRLPRSRFSLPASPSSSQTSPQPGWLRSSPRVMACCRSVLERPPSPFPLVRELGDQSASLARRADEDISASVRLSQFSNAPLADEEAPWNVDNSAASTPSAESVLEWPLPPTDYPTFTFGQHSREHTAENEWDSLRRQSDLLHIQSGTHGLLAPIDIFGSSNQPCRRSLHSDGSDHSEMVFDSDADDRDGWDGETSQSTTFYTARSSLGSCLSGRDVCLPAYAEKNGALRQGFDGRPF